MSRTFSRLQRHGNHTTELITLQCWVYRDVRSGIFSVELSTMGTVGVVKNIIKDRIPTTRFRDVEADNLLLYSMFIPGDDEEHRQEGLKQLSLEDKSHLNSRTAVSKLFPESDEREGMWLIVVDGPNSSSSATEFSVAVAPDMTSFAVETSSTKTVAALKEVIANKKPAQLALYKVSLPYGEDDSLEDVLGARTISSLGKPLRGWKKFDLKDAIEAGYRGGDLENLTFDRLRLYKISVNEEAELHERLRALGSGRLLQGHEWVERVSGDVPFFQTPRVVVEKTAKHPSLRVSAPSLKRERFEDPFIAHKRIRQSPSELAIPSKFQEHYQKTHEPHIRCGRPGENHSPFPLVLAHRIFATFVSECETYELSDEDLLFILQLPQNRCQLAADEMDWRMNFRACMSEYGINLTEAKIEGTECTTDADARVGTLPYLISEAKKDFGASMGDPYIQATMYHLAAMQSWLDMHPDDLCALPCIHIFYSGPVLGFVGSMLTEEFDVNILGPILSVFYHPMDIDMQIRCAKMFGALKNSATALKEYYEDTMPQSFADTRFPWVTQYDTITPPTETREYKYLFRMDGGHPLYICQHIDDKKRILIKFVRTYSKAAPLASAAKDGAPALLGHRDILSRGWSIAVTELLEEPDWVSGVKIVDKAEQHMVSDKEHVSTLHQQGFVHGDIRPQNILVRRPDAGHGDSLSVRLVDFDWAGEINKAKYPFFVNPDLGCGFKRPSGVKGGGVITMEHDLAMIDLMYALSDQNDLRAVCTESFKYGNSR